MKNDYGMVNREEGPLFGAAPARPRRDERKKLPKVAVGSSMILLAAGAICGYAALSNSAPAVGTTSLNAAESYDSASTMMMAPLDAAPLSTLSVVSPVAHDDMPPASEFDLDLDGKVSVEEYLHHAIQTHDSVLHRVKSADLSDTAKDFISDRLRRNYASEAWCVAQLAAKDLDSGAMAMNDFTLFYSIIHEVCDVQDPEIPPEYRPHPRSVTPAPATTSTPVTSTPAAPPPREKFPVANLPYGHAVKCDWDEPDVYRFTGDERRWYPDPAIAASWDPFWQIYLVVDCGQLTRGADMEFNGALPTAPPTKLLPDQLREGQPIKCEWTESEVYRFTEGDMKMFGTPSTFAPPPKFDPSRLTEGQPIKCDMSEPEVYRFTNGMRRWYPTPEIAASWDPMWVSFWDDVMVYLYTDGVRRWYPNPEIAASWDPYYNKAIVADCTLVIRGADMEFNGPPSPPRIPVSMLVEGQSIKCELDDSMVYRFMKGMRRWYPTEQIAASWDPRWAGFVLADCSTLIRGDDLGMNELPSTFTPPAKLDPSRLFEGQPIRCDWNDAMVYRYTDGRRRWYPTEVIATSWDPYWNLAVTADCSTLPRGDDMSVNNPNTPAPTPKSPVSRLVEGQAIKCDESEPEVYRFTNGMRRWYPTPAIASSWDPYWDVFVIADCTTFGRGENMKKKPAAIWNGQAVRCEGGASSEVYRFWNGTISLYADAEIAASWDVNWDAAEVMDCTPLEKGPKLPLKLPPPINLPEGQPIKCDPTSNMVFRYTSGMVRLYPSEAIAASWDPAWSVFIKVDCSSLKRGDDMEFKKPYIPENMLVRCEDSAEDFPVFLFENGTMRQCPTHDVAQSWDPNWMDAVAVFCAPFPLGDDTDTKPVAPTKLNEGQSVRCGKFGSGVFRFANGLLRRYRTPEVAMSWGVQTTDVVLADCSLLTVGDDMGYNQPPLRDGMAVRCAPDGTELYRFADRTLRLYPDTRIAESWDLEWRKAVNVYCDEFALGPPMTFFLGKLTEGQPVKCTGSTMIPRGVFRFAGGQLRIYTTPEIALSWDPMWEAYVKIDCTRMSFGLPMGYNWPVIPEGRTVRCTQGPALFRYSNRTIRYYATNEIAMSWGDELWASPMLVNCSVFTFGPDMTMKYPSPTGLVDGTPIKCGDNQAQVYRLTSGTRRLYPTEAIAVSWDPNWKNNVVNVDCTRLPTGDPMPDNKRLIEGQTVRCQDGGVFFRYTNGTLRLYPDILTAASWDRKYATAEVIDCSRLAVGPKMAVKPPMMLKEGQAIKCSGDLKYVYRYSCGQRRRYPTDAIAASWDPNWANFIVIDCEWVFDSVDMQLYTPVGSMMEEGLSMRCAGGDATYRFCSGQRRLYWDERTALSWDRSYATDFVSVPDCSSLPRGNTMMIKMPILPEGQAVKCDAGPDVYRYTRGGVRRYPTTEVAAWYDANWRSANTIDCEFLFHGSDMEYPRPSIPEGKAVKCDEAQPDVFRFASGELRLYPSEVVASSWDFFWSSNFTTVNCTTFPRGRNMEYRQPPVIDGQAVRCDNSNSPKIFRYVNGTLRLYPDPAIGASWDTTWSVSVLLNCTSLNVGKPMSLKLPPPTGLPEGQSIKCDPNDVRVYRLTGGQRRLYPNARVAFSWDARWESPETVDCADLQVGNVMQFNQPPVWEGAAVKCDETPAVYRFTGGVVRLYPNPEIAESWDPHWASSLVIDCGNLTVGAPMTKKLPSPFGFPEGSPIRCSPDQSEVYRLTIGQYRLYPTDRIARSWDSAWIERVTVVDCAALVQGPDMKFSQPPLVEGQPIKCDDGPNIYRYMNGKFHWYPNPYIANSWDPNWASPTFIDCQRLTQGSDLDFKLPTPFALVEGQAIHCGLQGMEKFRYTSRQIRLYPSEVIGLSWDVNWKYSTPVDCADVPRGPDMEFNQPFLPEGRAVRCIGDPYQRVYRYANGTIRFYPTGDIAWSWDTFWFNGLHVNCSLLRFGRDMPPRGGRGWNMIDGSLVQLSFDGKHLCGVNSNNDAMCASDRIRGEGAPTWRRLPNKFFQIVVYGDVLYGVTPDHELLVGSSATCNPGWRRIYSGVKHVATDNKQLCLVTLANKVQCSDAYIRSELLSVRELPGSFKQVELVNGRLFAIGVDGGAFAGRAHFDPAWARVSNMIEQVSFDGVRLCGVDSAGNAVCASEGLGTSPAWVTMDATMAYVVHTAGDVFGVDESGGIYHRSL
ncbi:hypothetical protein PybrP1_011620 [[Pythium] brassicae (nom. inval.)]|nr:hypothetical protein PybrP1_011620 [[Pythium] brassicae (nom. inval.)]